MNYDSDVIIVGSGPAGAAAALQLAEKTKPLVLDVGITGVHKASDQSYVTETLGTELEGLSHITGQYLTPKLRSPLFRYVTGRWRELSPIRSQNFRGELSLAMGGFANAWGSGLYEFNDEDLRGFPIRPADLQPYYKRLTEHIGISGGDKLFGDPLVPDGSLLPPAPLSGPSKILYQRSRDPRAGVSLDRKGIHIGRQRLGILTRPHRGRAQYVFDGRDFFRPSKESIYHPGYTIRELQQCNKIDFKTGLLVKRFEELAEGIVVHALELETGAEVAFSTRALFIGTGAINTARIVLESFQEYTVKLPLLENPVSFVPFIDLFALGSTLDRSSFTGAQLAVIFDGTQHPDRVQGSFYNLSGVLESDFFLDFPFSTRGNRYCLANIVGAMGVLQLFYSDAPGPAGHLSLAPDGNLNVHCEQRRYGAVERLLIKSFRALGFWSFPFLVRYGEPGGSFHYAGTLPMSHRETMKGLATDPMGRLQRTRMVFAIDASTFPLLPAKNLSLTIMANAMRIAAQVPI